MLHALLIDDEAAARADLREKLSVHRDVTVVGEAATLATARALLATAEYDLVFLDVQLIGGTSFQLAPLVRPGASIVFATAHEHYAARAYELPAVDYLLKPINPVRLAEALRRVANAQTPTRPTRDGPAHANASPALITSPAQPDPNRRSEPFPQTDEVALSREERVFLRQMLEAWEDSLPPNHLLRGQPGPARTVRYERNLEPTRLFLADVPLSAFRRWWRALHPSLTAQSLPPLLLPPPLPLAKFSRWNRPPVSCAAKVEKPGQMSLLPHAS